MNSKLTITATDLDLIFIHQIENVEILEDRQMAITSALRYLTKENILVILGKGHETSMEISGNKVPFNDRDCVLEILDNEIN